MLDELGERELARRWDHARRIIHDNGVTHNVYGDPNGLDRPWNLDFIPLLIPSLEWQRVREGLIQRARLLDCLLADLYGPMTTILGGCSLPSLFGLMPASCVRVMVSCLPKAVGSISTPRIWSERPMANSR